MQAGRVCFLAWIAFVGLALNGATMAQISPQPDGAARGETVSWTVSASPEDSIKAGSRLTLTLRGTVQDGWHLYSLKQAPDGPTPLLISLGANSVASAGGAVTGTPPIRRRDPAFGLDTQYYEQAFTLTVPVRLKPNLKPGQQAIPLNVRFQTCNGTVCQPPKTVHLSASVNLAGR